MIITGDTNQYDRHIGQTGLGDIMHRIDEKRSGQMSLPGFITGDAQGDELSCDEEPARRYERIGVVKLTRDDVCRHPVIEEVLELYGE
jgi:phosphate starvation-inducible protein PhoH